MSDIAAAAAVGCRTVLVTCGRHDAPLIVTVNPLADCRPDHRLRRPTKRKQLDSKTTMKAMVLYAGFGTRLGDLTREIPKPMLSLRGRPMLEYILCNLQRHGFDEIGLNLHFMPETIREYSRRRLTLVSCKSSTRTNRDCWAPRAEQKKWRHSLAVQREFPSRS